LASIFAYRLRLQISAFQISAFDGKKRLQG